MKTSQLKWLTNYLQEKRKNKVNISWIDESKQAAFLFIDSVRNVLFGLSHPGFGLGPEYV